MVTEPSAFLRIVALLTNKGIRSMPTQYNIKLYLRAKSSFEGVAYQVKTALGLLLVIIIGTTDFLVGLDIFDSIFYLIPVILTTWLTDRLSGFLISFASATAWLIVDVTTRASYAHPLIYYCNAALLLGLFLISAHLLSSLKQRALQAENLANTDYLTGAVNRRLFWDVAKTEINRFHRYKHPLTIAYIDIDNFKAFNDTFGHTTGDTLLYSVAENIRNNVRATDVIARLGGDEFALLLPETGYEQAQVFLQRVQKHLLYTMQQKEWPATFSIGAVTFIKPPDSVDEMIEKADCLMYFVKNNGKNLVEHRIVV